MMTWAIMMEFFLPILEIYLALIFELNTQERSKTERMTPTMTTDIFDPYLWSMKGGRKAPMFR